MSVSENVTKQVCAIDYFIGKYSFLLINQFIRRENFLINQNSTCIVVYFQTKSQKVIGAALLPVYLCMFYGLLPG